MKLGKLALLLVVLSTSLAGGAAWADRGHQHRHSRSSFHFGVVVGSPWGWPYYAPAPYYYPYYPPQVIVRPAPVYIERTDFPSEPPAPQAYWYYCAATKGYYPYVRECPSGWQPVAPQPPNAR